MSMDPNLAALFIVALLAFWRAHRERNAGYKQSTAQTARLFRGQLPQDDIQ